MHLLLESSSGPFALADCHVLGDSGSPTSLRRLVSVDSARLRDEGVVALTVSPNSRLLVHQMACKDAKNQVDVGLSIPHFYPLNDMTGLYCTYEQILQPAGSLFYFGSLNPP
jgi:hypothetical protein